MSSTVIRPLMRYGALYALVELAVFALLIWAVGVGWTLVIAALTFLAGVLLAASGLKGQVVAVRRARRDPHGAVADGALVGVGSFLVFLPGIASTALGALMLAPPTRAAMRPVAASMVSRGLMRRIRMVNADHYADQRVGQFAGQFAGPGPVRRDYIDGEVLGEVIERLPAGR